MNRRALLTSAAFAAAVAAFLSMPAFAEAAAPGELARGQIKEHVDRLDMLSRRSADRLADIVQRGGANSGLLHYDRSGTLVIWRHYRTGGSE